jgi:hypoxanthine phosphoribosyltransferase
MIALMDKLQFYGPSSVTVVSLLVKRHGKVRKFEPHFVGFSIPDVFVVGYGLDYNEIFRDLQPIAVINSQGVEKYAN